MARLSDDEFLDFCAKNRDWRIERTAEGDLLIMPPTGGDTGMRNHEISFQVGLWARKDGTGIVFDSSTGFRLKNGADRSPDVSWVRRDTWEALTPKQRAQLPPIAPDLVIELRSANDSLVVLQHKMKEYIENGSHIGLLIDPYKRFVEIYRASGDVVRMDNPAKVDLGPDLKGLVLKMKKIWG